MAITPALTSTQEIWDLFIGFFGTAVSFQVLIGMLFLTACSYAVWKIRGIAEATFVTLIGFMIIVDMGLLPPWVKVLIYSLVGFMAMRIYGKTTE